MAEFLTECETEELLAHQTRTLSLPCGRSEVVTHTNHVWELFDLIKQANMFTHDEIMQLARENMQDTGYSFTEAFVSTVTYIHSSMVTAAQG